MLRTSKRLIFGSLRKLGATSLFSETAWRRNRLLIIAYHGTSLDDEHEWNSSLYMTASALRSRLALIRDTGCNVLPLGSAVSKLYSGELPPRSVVLTVDDGNYDFYAQAYPVYESFGFPVTVYLTTYYTALNRPVYDPMVAYLLWKGRGRMLCWPKVLGRADQVELAGPAAATVYERLRTYPAEEGLSGAEKDALLEQLAELLDLDYSTILRRRILQLMTVEEARELAIRGVEFQLHTHRHAVSFNKRLFAREIADNRECLARISPREATHFCYPSGAHCPEFLTWLREWNIVSATTCDRGLASRTSEALLLPRLLDNGLITEDEFVGWLSGLAALFPRRPVKRQGRVLER